MKAAIRPIRSWLPHLNSVVLIAAAVAIVMTASICWAGPPIGVSCALPINNGNSTPACVAQHTVTYATTNTDNNAKVMAELLGLDANGNLINSFIVQNGDK